MASFDQRNQQVDTQYNAGRDISIYQQVAPLSITQIQQKRNRTAMLQRVHQFWIKGVLEHNLHGITPIALRLREQPDLVSNPWQTEIQEIVPSTRNLPVDTDILQGYKDAEGALLLLGEPGAGKTTLLLELTHELLDQAAHDEMQPIPVVFNLSSWTDKNFPLEDWFVEALEQIYLVPRKVAVSWLANDQLLPLLDGLDEVDTLHRDACCEAINIYHREHGLIPLVVCSRTSRYQELKARLHLQRAFIVQSLSRQQIDEHLAQAGEEMNGVRRALAADPVLQELAGNPLMLSILMLVYQGRLIENLATNDNPTAQRQRIIADYVQRMLQKKTPQTHYSQEQVIHWLTWLAKQLTYHNQAEFLLERMQPDWLQTEKEQRLYERLAVRLPGALIGIGVGPVVWIAVTSLSEYGLQSSLFYIILTALIGGLIGRLFSGRDTAQQQESVGKRLLTALGAGVIVGLAVALAYGLLYPASWDQALIEGGSFGAGSYLLSALVFNGIIGRVNTNRQQSKQANGQNSWSPLLKAAHLKNGIIAGLVYGLCFEVSYLFMKTPPGFLPPLSALIYGIIFAMSTTILSLILTGLEDTIEPLEIITWSWSRVGRSLTNVRQLGNGMLVGALAGLLCGLGLALSSIAGSGNSLQSAVQEGLSYAVSDALSVGLSYWFLTGLFQGLASETIDEQQRVSPNQGIRLSARNGLLIGIITACVSGVLGFLSIVLRTLLGISLQNDYFRALNNVPSSLREALIGGIIIGLACGLIVGLLKGGLAGLRHGILRILLWRDTWAPLNYPDFLEEAETRVLLNKVGGGYIFVHRLLLSHFASYPISAQEQAGPKQEER